MTLEDLSVHDQLFTEVCPLARRAARARLAAAVSKGIVAPQDFADLEQDALLAVWRSLNSYDARRAGLRTYTERVVAAWFASALRSRRTKPRFEPVEGLDLVGSGIIPAVEFHMDLLRASACLSERDRDLVALLIDLSPTE